MGDYEDSKKELVELLRSIQSLDDLKENKDRMIDAHEKFIVVCVDTLKDFFDNLPNYTPEEKQAQVERFSDEKFIMDDEIDAEMVRIYNLPDCSEYMDQLDPEVQARLEPPMNEYLQLLQTKMMEMMGDMMGIVGETMGAMAEGMGMVAQDMAQSMQEAVEEDEFYEPPEEAREFLFSIPHYLRMRTLDELKEDKDGLFEDINELFGEKIENITIMYEMEVPKSEIGDKLKNLMKTSKLTDEEVGKLFDRMEERSGEKEYVDSLRTEFKNCMDPIEERIRDLKYRFTQN